MNSPTVSGHGIGLHLMFLPAMGSMRIPRLAKRDIMDTVLEAAMQTSCTYKECCAREDHVHVLVEALDEQTVSDFIHLCMEGIITVVASYYPHFTLSDKVHVTLLPPWHLEIMASFLRDQDRFHETRTVDQEISEIFLPHALEADASGEIVH